MSTKTKRKTVETLAADTIDSDFDVRREANIAAQHIRDTGRRAAAHNKRMREAEREELELDQADDYGDAIRLGYVWATLVIVIAGLILATAWGVLPL